ALSPMVDFLRRKGVPMVLSVILSVAVAFAAIGLFLAVVTWQMGHLVTQLPTFQGNIVAKLDALQAGRSENGLIAQLARMASEISERISSATAVAAPGEAAPLQVELVQRQNPLA